MYCVACGQYVSEGDAFCRRCGAATRPTHARPAVEAPEVAKPHSGIGIASFALAFVSLVLVILSLCSVTIGGVSLVGFSLLAALLAFGLGIAGVSLNSRKRLYASMGVYLAVLVLLIKAFALFVWLAVHAA